LEQFIISLDSLTSQISNIIATPLIPILLGSGLIVTISLRFIQVRRLKHSFDVLTGKYDNPADKGDVTHFQALSTALAATIGIGNIAGVAFAIQKGGPGAIFWMWMTAILGMSLKYAESTLALKFRIFDKDGKASGGPMYYIEKGLGKKWKSLAVFFAAFTIIASFCSGNMNQANTIAQTYNDNFGIPFWVSGLILSFFVGLVIIGGIKRISIFAEKLVPTMSLVYVLSAIFILILFYDRIIPSFQLILKEAFSLKAGIGGLFTVIMWGIRRGLYSNEAGQGSAPIAHAAAKTKEPVREGIVALMGPFIDTIIICSMTALIILSTDALNSNYEGALLTKEAFTRGFYFAPFLGATIINLSVLLFAYSTMLAWSYYGDRCVEYLFGATKLNIYRYFYILFVFLGCVLPVNFVWNFGDIALTLMAIPNLLAIILLMNILKVLKFQEFPMAFLLEES